MLNDELNIPEDKICLNCEWGIENGARDKYWCICPEQIRSNKEPYDSCEHFLILKNIRYYYEAKDILDRYRGDTYALKQILNSMERIDTFYKEREQAEKECSSYGYTETREEQIYDKQR